MTGIENLAINKIYSSLPIAQRANRVISFGKKPVAHDTEKLTNALEGLALNGKTKLKINESDIKLNKKICLAIEKLESNASEYQDLTYDKISADKQLEENIKENLPEIFVNLKLGKDIIRKTKLYNRSTKKYVDAYIMVNKLGEISIHTAHEQLGEMTLKNSNAAYADVSYIIHASKPYKKGDFLEVHSLKTKNRSSRQSKYRGIGTELIKQAVIESYKRGHSGRITCTSIWDSGGFYERMGMKKAGSKGTSIYAMSEENIVHLLLK